MKQSRAERVFVADLASEADRYEDAVAQLKSIINDFGGRLTVDERSLLSIAYKNITNKHRNSWRIIDNLEKVYSSRSSAQQRDLALMRRQRDRIENELTDVCKDIVALLDKQLLPAATSGEETVFYAKMKGDYYRYLAEFAQKGEREQYAELSLGAYKVAYKHAMATLEPIHPTRLGLALNFSVFYHDVRKSPEHACHLAKTAFDDAVLSLDTTEANFNLEHILKDSINILQLLKDDLILWNEELQ
ncbi:hypothetical protein AX16_003154 [Volvariella volvacea WC 439]|nr:hypothetical protein AX16_003154 [Volvariella volvacea WC 439]